MMMIKELSPLYEGATESYRVTDFLEITESLLNVKRDKK